MRLIDADALIDIFEDRLEKIRNRYGDYSGEAGVCAGALHLIRVEPTIEERKKGKWIQFPDHMAYKCSECGRVIQTTDGQRNVSKHYPFCHCGADMRQKENDNV